MAVRAADVVAPVFAPAEVVVLFPAGVASQTSFGNQFRTLVFEGDNLFRIPFLCVGLTWSVARFTARYLALPGTQVTELRVGSVKEVVELVLVAGFAGLSSDILIVDQLGPLWRVGACCGRVAGKGTRTEPQQRAQNDQKHYKFEVLRHREVS